MKKFAIAKHVIIFSDSRSSKALLHNDNSISCFLFSVKVEY